MEQEKCLRGNLSPLTPIFFGEKYDILGIITYFCNLYPILNSLPT